MADNYIQFSEGLYVTPEQSTWLKARIAEIESTEDQAILERYEVQILSDENPLDFQVKFGPDGDDDSVWFYAEESGNPWQVAILVQDMFRHFKDHQSSFAISWSMSCSKPREAEFGGGTYFVTAETIEVCDSHSFRDEKIRDWQLKGPEQESKNS